MLLEAATHNPSIPGSAAPEAPTATNVMTDADWPPPGKRSGPTLTPGKLGLIRQALTGILAEHSQATFSAESPAPFKKNPDMDNLFLNLLQVGVLYRKHYRPPLKFEDDVREIFLSTGQETWSSNKPQLLQEAFYQAVSDGRINEPLTTQDIFNLTATLAKEPSWEALADKDRPTTCMEFLRHTLQNIKIACTFLRGKAQSTPPAIKTFRILGEDNTTDIADAFFSPARTEYNPTHDGNTSGMDNKTTWPRQLENDPPDKMAARELTDSL